MKRTRSLGSVLLVPVVLAACGTAYDPAREGTGPAAGLTAGVYDFYGTFSDNPVYTDGSGDCAIPPPLGCPSVTHACIHRLHVLGPDGLGVQEVRGCSDRPEDPFYDAACRERFWDVAVGKVYMMAFVLSDWDGNGQVTGRLDSLGGQVAAVSETRMVVEESPGPGPGFRITDWSTGLADPAASPPGTLVLTIPYQNNLKPPPPPDSPPGTYSPPASTTGEAVAAVHNPEAGETLHQALGTSLACGRVRLVTPHAIFRTVIGGIVPMGSDVLSITAWDGTLCRRTDPETSCVPEDFTCPAVDD